MKQTLTHTHKHLSLYASAFIYKALLQPVSKLWCSLFKNSQQLWTHFSPSAHFLSHNLVSTIKSFNTRRNNRII